VDITRDSLVGLTCHLRATSSYSSLFPASFPSHLTSGVKTESQKAASLHEIRPLPDEQGFKIVILRTRTDPNYFDYLRIMSDRCYFYAVKHSSFELKKISSITPLTVVLATPTFLMVKKRVTSLGRT
jgi:hypothetical protein